jgi:hypothetical protein
MFKRAKEIGEMGRDKRKGREQRKRSERKQAGKGPGARSTQYYLITLGHFNKMCSSKGEDRDEEKISIIHQICENGS